MVRRRFGRAAALGLATTLLALTLISLLGVTRTRNAATSVARSTALSEAYARAARAVAAEESLERKYRLEPGRDIRARHTAAGADLAEALREVRALGDASDRTLVGAVLEEHSRYLNALERMFAAVDRGDDQGVLDIDGAEVDPSFEKIDDLVTTAAEAHSAAAAAAMVQLRRTESQVFAVTVAGFTVGLAVLASFAAVVLSYQRALVRQSEINRHQATHDGLTGLANRSLFTDRLVAALAESHRTGAPLAVLVIDLDRFKDVNDSLGHRCGDLLLCQVGPRVGAALGAPGEVARLAGDEFAVLLPGTDLAGARAGADRVLAALHASFAVEDVTVDMEASIGVAAAPDHGTDPEQLLHNADAAMYRAKDARAGVGVYDPHAHVQAPGGSQLLGDLRRALGGSDELVLDYQPKVGLAGGELRGVEALLRWQHPERGLLSPAAFVPKAETTGLINQLTMHVLTLAARQARAWADQGHRIQVAVNLSARCLHDSALPGRVGELLLAHGVPPELLRLEVTESSVMVDPTRSLAVLNAVHQLGIGLSIDDFGTGYSSLAYLKRMPVDELKIDKSFVVDMVDDPNDAAIVRGAVDLGHNLGLTVVAEGVESDRHTAALAALGCDIGQGHHFAEPMTGSDLVGWLAGTAPSAAQPQPTR